MIRSNKKIAYIVSFLIILFCAWFCYRVIFPSVDIPVSPAKEIHKAKKETADYKTQAQDHVEKSQGESVKIYDQTAKEVTDSTIDSVAGGVVHELQLFERDLRERGKNNL